MEVIAKLERSSYSPGGLVKTQITWPTLKFLIPRWGLRICISRKFPIDAEADDKCCPRTLLFSPLVQWKAL